MIRPYDVCVVAGGPSFKAMCGHHRKLPGYVIAVNDAAVNLTRTPDAVVSMDRLWTEYRWPNLSIMQKPTWLRDAAIKNIPTARAQSWVQVFKNDNKTCHPSIFPSTLNGSNSGACAINLAIRMFPRRLWLFGFDMGRQPGDSPYWYDPYPWAPEGKTGGGKYKAWAEQVEVLAEVCKEAGIQALQVGPRFSLAGFGLVRYPDALEEFARTEREA